MAQRMIPLDLALSPQLAAQRRRQLGMPLVAGQRDESERETMRMLSKLQPTVSEMNFMRGREQAMKPAVSVAGGSTTPKPEQAGFLSRLGRGALDYIQDPESRARAAMAFNAMRLQPDPNLASAMQTRATGIQERRQQAQTANRTAQHLRQIGKPNLADMVEADPTLAADALSMAYDVGGVSDKFFAPKTDPETGAEYVTRVDPNTGKVEIVLTGGKQLTPEQKFRLEQEVKTEAADFNQAQKVGVDAMKSYDQIQEDINNLEQALAAVKARPGITGPLAQYLPNITAEAAAFERAANQLGLGVVSGTTFGALSASELNLALRTNIDRGLPADQQIKQLENIISLRRKMANAMYDKARELAAGDVKYSDYIESQRPKNLQAPSTPTAAPVLPSTTTPPPLSSSASSYFD